MATAQDGTDRPYVLLISFDGFRYDYEDLHGASNFRSMAENGAKAASLIPSFPSKTFPNHYTIVTGMYPQNHGLVDNSFYDPTRQVTYVVRNRELVQDAYFYGGIPLWQLLSRNGLKSGSYYWVGSEAPVAGSFPDYYKLYDGSVPNEERIKAVFEWFDLPPSERPHLVTLYFSDVDMQGHRYGPTSQETKETVRDADRLLGIILDNIAAQDLPINVIVTSDHGMVPVKNEAASTIDIRPYFDGIADEIQYVTNGTHCHVYVDNKVRVKDVFQHIKALAEPARVYLKSETPEHWHYNQGNRLGDIIITAPAGMELRDKPWKKRDPGTYYGAHGYDPMVKDTHGIFYAMGPNIRPGSELPPVENIHIYPLIAEILQLPVDHPIDGKLEVMQTILQPN